MSGAGDLIRDAFARAAEADPPANPKGVVTAVRKRLADAAAAERREVERLAREQAETAKAEQAEAAIEDVEVREPRDKGKLAVVAGGVALALALVGGVLTVALGGTGELNQAVITTSDRVHMYRCPGSEPVGILEKGDEVQSLARSSDQRWLAVRVTADQTDVWVSADDVRSDVPPAQLPVARCSAKNAVEIDAKKSDETEASAAEETTTTEAWATTTDAPTTTAALTVTTTVKPATSPPRAPSSPGSGPPSAPKAPTPVAPPAPPPTSPPPTLPPPPPTAPPDTVAPQLSSLAAAPGQIYENTGLCAGSTAKTTAISIAAVDNVGVATVTMAWRYAGSPFADQGGATSRSMSLSSGKYRGTLGPFGDVKSPGITLVLTVTASDAAGNTSTASINVTVFSCG